MNGEAKRGRIARPGVAAMVALAALVGPAPGQDLNTKELRSNAASGEDSASRIRQSNPDASLMEALGAMSNAEIVAPGNKAPDSSELRQVADPRTEDAFSEGEAEDDAPPEPKRSFDLFDSPATGPARPVESPSLADRATPQKALTPVDARDPLQTGATARREDLLKPANPPLAAGIADEALAADSPLRANQATEAIDRIKRFGRTEDDPFAPVGIRVGRFLFYPELIQTVGATNNIGANARSQDGFFSETTLSSRLISDWSRHEAEFNTRFTYRRNFAGETRHDPSGSADGRLRLDLSRGTTATFRGAIDFQREDYSDVVDTISLSGRANVLNGSVAAEISHDFDPVDVSGTLTAARKAYFDMPRGSVDEDYTTLTASLRAGYEISPSLKPFVAASLGRRIHDVDVPPSSSGPGRNAWLPSIRGGISLDFDEKLVGEIALGYAWNSPDDDAVVTIGAPTIDASLVWSAQRGTDVTLAARTSFAPDLTGQSVSTNYETSLGVAHDVTARTTLTAVGKLGYEDSSLKDQDVLLLTGEAGFTTWINRSFAVTGSYNHRRAFAIDPSNRYTADTVQLGLKYQR